ncbi:MAG: ABC transporter ATP-binding protein [Gammaproteobacteria bacterium]|nr:MAG: ABC transporter ATP-binding protein [Gammaproteobacteria bacterium]
MKVGIFFSLNRLWKFFSIRRKKQYILLITLMMFVSFCEILSIGAVIPFLAVLADPEIIYNQEYVLNISRAFAINEPDDLILPFALLFIIAIIISSVARIVLVWFSTKLSFETGLEIGADIFKKTLYQPYKIHVESNSSEIINGIVRKTDFIIQDIILESTRVISSFFFILVVISFLVFINPQMAISVFLGLGVLYSLIIFFNKSRLSLNSKKISLNTNKVMKSLQESLGGIKQVIVDGTQETFYQKFINVDVPLKKAQASTQVLVTLPRFFIEALGMILIVIVALIFTKNYNGISNVVPFLGALALGAQRLLPVLNQGYAGISFILGGEESLKDILNFLDRSPSIALKKNIEKLEFNKSISFEEVCFRYKEDNHVLENLSLSIQKNSVVGLAGETGSGKTSTLDLILGILSPNSGRMMVDDIEIEETNVRKWQNNLSHVPQNIFLSDTTIRENIAFGLKNENIKKEQLENVADIALVSDFIKGLPKGLDTKIGERGVQLSGGQLQRIGIARALFRMPEVLILDEATSSLDNITERKIIKNIQNIPNITVIMVAHRLSTLENCEKIFYLKNGAIQGEGSFKELSQNNNDFKNMLDAINKH